MSLEAKITDIKSRFENISDWEERYKEIIRIGKTLTPMTDGDKEDKFKVKGCQSLVWLKPSYADGIVTFHADSDAILVKGIIGLLIEVYSGHGPDEILKNSPEFLKEIGITDHLSMNRTNGLASMMKQIQMYAVAYNSLKEKGILAC